MTKFPPHGLWILAGQPSQTSPIALRFELLNGQENDTPNSGLRACGGPSAQAEE